MISSGANSPSVPAHRSVTSRRCSLIALATADALTIAPQKQRRVSCGDQRRACHLSSTEIRTFLEPVPGHMPRDSFPRSKSSGGETFELLIEQLRLAEFRRRCASRIKRIKQPIAFPPAASAAAPG